ncbi:50S ribosomal protein L18, partial [Patescibacteria group bacterium]|nr:50S ribosomal protein L18 [Patescibacteria group bacterium]
RTRAKIFGTAKRPRLSIFRSNKHVYAQLIDDEKGKTLASAHDYEIKKTEKGKTKNVALVGRLIAKKAADSKIEEVVFDKGGYKYHGIVKALAEGAREAGLKF